MEPEWNLHTFCHLQTIAFGQMFAIGKTVPLSLLQGNDPDTCALFAWFISHQPTVFFSQNKSATSNQPAVIFSRNKPTPAISHQPNEQAVVRHDF
jgi:hypothetical protein